MWLTERHLSSVGTVVRQCGHRFWMCRHCATHSLQKEWPQGRLTGLVKIDRQIEQIKSSVYEAEAMALSSVQCSGRVTKQFRVNVNQFHSHFQGTPRPYF